MSGGTPGDGLEPGEGNSPELNELAYGGAYNFKNQPERLKYVGKNKSWHQFEKIGSPGVWCELLDSDLHLIEKTKAT